MECATTKMTQTGKGVGLCFKKRKKINLAKLIGFVVVPIIVMMLLLFGMGIHLINMIQ